MFRQIAPIALASPDTTHGFQWLKLTYVQGPRDMIAHKKQQFCNMLAVLQFYKQTNKQILASHNNATRERKKTSSRVFLDSREDFSSPTVWRLNQPNYIWELESALGPRYWKGVTIGDGNPSKHCKSTALKEAKFLHGAKVAPEKNAIWSCN